MSACEASPALSQNNRNEIGVDEGRASLITDVADILLSALYANEALIAITPLQHSTQLQQALKDRLGEPAYSAYLRQGMCIFLDAEMTLERISLHGWPSEEMFNQVIGHEVAQLQQRTNRPIRVFGQMIAMLCVRGQLHAAIQLETLWHGLAAKHSFSVLQDYGLSAVAAGGQLHDRRAASHGDRNNGAPVDRSNRFGRGNPIATQLHKSMAALQGHLEKCHPPKHSLERHDQIGAAQALALKEMQAQLRHEITKRQELENSLSHIQYVHNIAQQTAHLGSWEVDVKTGQVQASDEFFRICGLEPQSIKLDIEFIQGITHPDDREFSASVGRTSFEEKTPYKVEKRIVRPDNTIRHVLSQGEFILNAEQEVVKAIGSFLDITELRKAEYELRDSHNQLRKLSAYQEKNKEDERKRIARELHDELGGLLTGIKAYLSILSGMKGNDDKKNAELLRESADIADMAIRAVQRIVNDLRPSILDQLGIWAAIRWYAERFVQSAGIACSCNIDEAAENSELAVEPSISLFRVCQEAMTNVIRHSQASAVAIRAYCDADALTVEIEDNGKGFEINTLHGRTSWGIAGMRERIHQCGGRIDIESRVGAGTVVRLSLQLEKILYENEKNFGVASR